MDVNKVLTQIKGQLCTSPLCCGHAAVVKALIEAGADVNKPASPHTVNASGQRTGVLHNVTPVYLAAQEGHTHVVMELIKAGADVNQATSDGLHPALRSRSKWARGFVALLIQAGADVRKAVKDGYTPMKVATAAKREKVVTLLKFYERV